MSLMRWFIKIVVEEVGFFGPHGVHDFESEVHVAAFVAKHPVGAVGEAVEQTLRPQKVDIGECCEEEQAFDAGGETDQVQQELATLVLGVELGDAVQAAPCT